MNFQTTVCANSRSFNLEDNALLGKEFSFRPETQKLSKSNIPHGLLGGLFRKFWMTEIKKDIVGVFYVKLSWTANAPQKILLCILNFSPVWAAFYLFNTL